MQPPHPRRGSGCPPKPHLEPTELRVRDITLYDDNQVHVASFGLDGALGERAVQVDAGEIGAQDVVERSSQLSQGGGEARRNVSHSSVLTHSDGYVAWVGDLNQLVLVDALTTWFGPPAAAWGT